MEDLVTDPYPAAATCPDGPMGGRGQSGNGGVVGGHCSVGGHHVNVPVPPGHFLTGGGGTRALEVLATAPTAALLMGVAVLLLLA